MTKLEHSHSPEYKIVKALSKGDIDAFNHLFKLYSGRLYRFAMGYLKSEVEAEEIVQDVFLKIWEKRAELKEELSLKSYLFTIAFNIIRKHFNKKNLTNLYFESTVFDDLDLNTQQNTEYQSTKELIEKIIGQLPPRRKLVFIRSRLEGYTIREIAEELGTSPKTVENQLGEALRSIREQLKQEHLAVLIFFMLFYS